MSAPINDGGPAFPVSTNSKGDDEHGPYGHQDSTATWQFPGMTLRDYFAAKALGGMLGGAPGSHLRPDNAAREAYQYADAMLMARQA